MTTYINFKGVEGVETVDEFHTRKDAKVALSEYQMQRNPGGTYYISSRSTKDWRESHK